MFDEIEFAADLYGQAKGTVFQTKSLDCRLDRYVVNEYKYLTKNGEIVDYTGEIYFYEDRNNAWIMLVHKGCVLIVERIANNGD